TYTIIAYPTRGFTGTRGEAKCDVSNEHGLEYKPIGTGRGGHFSSDNGSHKHSGRRASTHNAKDADGSSNMNEGKPSKRGVSAGYVSNEKRVWVQKPSSGT
nr:regulator of nonsense transcripts UPF3-like isoform X1 [Tanacetum cinerariifolium]